MSGLVHAIFGGGPQDEMLALQQRQQAEQAKVEAGQRKLLEGGGTGLLAYTGDSTGQPDAKQTGSGMTAMRGLNRLLSGAS
jgi:hypothetical protein